MKRKILILLMVIMLCVSGVFSNVYEIHAEELEEDIDFSFLLTDDALVGYNETQTFGLYLVSGQSIISEISSTKIGAGGITNASMVCKVSITSIVERKTDSGWTRVTSWTQTNASDVSAMISKSLTVATGYYYRVRSLHYAASDSSSSYTSALAM